MSEALPDELPTIVLRIPGCWNSPRDLNERLQSAGTGYELSLSDNPDDSALVESATGVRFTIDVAGPDNEIADVFAGDSRISEDDIEAIRNHDVKIFISCPGGSVEAACAAMAAGAAVIRAGGLGVMVDNCGAVHSPSDWLKLADDADNGGIYWGLVSVTGTPDVVFSTGMHCLGFRDAELPDPPADLNAAAYLMHNFLGYAYQSGAILVDGDPIGDPDGAMFRIRHIPCDRFPPGSTFHNPYGVWRLEPFVEDDEI